MRPFRHHVCHTVFCWTDHCVSSRTTCLLLFLFWFAVCLKKHAKFCTFHKVLGMQSGMVSWGGRNSCQGSYGTTNILLLALATAVLAADVGGGPKRFSFASAPEGYNEYVVYILRSTADCSEIFNKVFTHQQQQVPSGTACLGAALLFLGYLFVLAQLEWIYVGRP